MVAFHLPLALFAACAAPILTEAESPTVQGPVFTDRTTAAGITYRNIFGSPEKHFILESHGSGAAFYDHDSDGDLDLYIANGATFDTYWNRSGPGNELYRNDGDGTFTEITQQTNVGDAGWAGGVAVGDIDNDGNPDLYIGNYGANVLYRNSSENSYADITTPAGVAGDAYSAGAAFFDYDNDGDLDLYVANYVKFDAANRPTDPTLCTFFGGLRVYCGPKGMVGAPDVLYRNEGDGQFSNVTQTSGVAKANRYYGLGVIPSDYDHDGDQDLFVANDETPNVLFQNQGDSTFRDVGLIAGVAYNGDGDAEAGMGVDFGDYDNDGDPDLYVTHFFTETNTLYRNEGGRFTDVTNLARLAAPTVDLLGWGTRFFDYDNDGLLDLFVANGHVYPQVDRIETGSTYRQPNQLFHNKGDGTFLPIDAGPDLARKKVSRGTTFGDYDDDGDIDLLVVELNDDPTLLRNDGGNANSWLAIKVIGTDDNRNGAGTRIRLQAGGRDQWREINGAASYLSHNDLRAYFGLKNQKEIDRIEITWPNGSTYAINDMPTNKLLVVRQDGGHIIQALRANP